MSAVPHKNGHYMFGGIETLSLIVCSKNCKFQKDGYCFKETTEVKMFCATMDDCVYFDDNHKTPLLDIEQPASFGNGAGTN